MTPRTKALPQVEPLIWTLIAHQRVWSLRPRVFQMGRRLRREQGTAILEFAMVAMLLLTVVFGVMAIFFALYAYNVVSEAAREGTRFAIVRGSNCTRVSTAKFPSACPASSSDIQSYVQYRGYPGIDPNFMTVNTTWSATPGTTCATTACNDPGNQVQVNVIYQLPLVLPFLRSETISVSNTAQMVISQ
jgi:Flp pilus assembly protein TadG